MCYITKIGTCEGNNREEQGLCVISSQLFMNLNCRLTILSGKLAVFIITVPVQRCAQQTQDSACNFYFVMLQLTTRHIFSILKTLV